MHRSQEAVALLMSIRRPDLGSYFFSSSPLIRKGGNLTFKSPSFALLFPKSEIQSSASHGLSLLRHRLEGVRGLDYSQREEKLPITLLRSVRGGFS